MMTEEAARIRHAAEEICDQIGEGEILQGAEQYLHYFIRRPSRFLSICRRTAAFSSMSRTASSSVPMRWKQNFRRA